MGSGLTYPRWDPCYETPVAVSFSFPRVAYSIDQAPPVLRWTLIESTVPPGQLEWPDEMKFVFSPASSGAWNYGPAFQFGGGPFLWVLSPLWLFPLDENPPLEFALFMNVSFPLAFPVISTAIEVAPPAQPFPANSPWRASHVYRFDALMPQGPGVLLYEVTPENGFDGS